MKDPLPPQYDPSQIEQPLYAWWLARRLWHPSPDDPRPAYVIMLPPPNVTASLHMGHGLNQSIQDALIRFERMRGRRALWLPGTDHAGIATQNVVERLLAREGRTRFDLGREAFVERVWDYVRETGDTILQQMHALGVSCDWERTYFTLDAARSRAVREVFVLLYDRDLIYRGLYIINWCPRCLTALSNEEAERHDTDGSLYFIRYPDADGGDGVVVATTRPETMLGDTGVAVHPEDDRYRGLVGRRLRLPLTDRLLPVIADAAVDPDFGTGAVKMTPAHDPLDFEIGRRHALPALDIMTPDARLNQQVPERFRGLDREVAREAVVAELRSTGLLVRVEPHRHAVGRCYRCETVVEPRLSEQWFVRMAPLAGPALQAYRDGRLRFIPERRGEEYAHWLEHIRDWCISRQIWWGHRIPVWYCERAGCGRTIASRTDLTACPTCGGSVRQDDDVLDTWFSSQLVPFSALGWPENTPDLRAFYPGHTMVTAPEILFFWVARMVMIGLEVLGELPFTTVYLHGTVRDTLHRKMSKSLGNGIDPLEVTHRYGADALRFVALSGAGVGTDVILDPDDLEASFAAGRNFANKLWNAGRFILGHLAPPQPHPRPLAGPYPDVVRRDELALADRWIIARCDAAVREVTLAFEKFRLNDAAAAAYRFLWDDLADWYIEQVKPRLYGHVPGGDVARAVLVQTFDVALRLLHPVMPFITEALWRRLPGRPAEASISLAPWPKPDPRAADPEALADFALVQELVSAVRSIRAEYAVPPGREVRVTVGNPSPAARRAVRAEEITIRRLAKVAELRLVDQPTAEPGAGHAVLRDGTTVTVPLGELIDLDRECRRLGAELARLADQIARQEARLGNTAFVTRAPAAVVAREREKLAAWKEQADMLRLKRARLGCPPP
jgi:valyl-tRNA synthetase